MNDMSYEQERRASRLKSGFPQWVLCDAHFFFEPRDLWIGVYWHVDDPMDERLDVYLCLVPTLPLRFMFLRGWLLRQWNLDRCTALAQEEPG